MSVPSPEEVRAWGTFAEERGYDFTPPSAYPNDDLCILAQVDGTAIALSTRAQKKGGHETRARAVARHAMVGRVEIRRAQWTDGPVGIFRGRSKTGHADLDATLSTFTSSGALLDTVVDPLTVEILRELHDAPRFALVYEDGAITVRWAGIERARKRLDAAVRLSAYLAVAGCESSPYR